MSVTVSSKLKAKLEILQLEVKDTCTNYNWAKGLLLEIVLNVIYKIKRLEKSVTKHKNLDIINIHEIFFVNFSQN